MLIHPQIDPVALQLGPVALHWYRLTYLAAFALFMWLGSRRLRQLRLSVCLGIGFLPQIFSIRLSLIMQVLLRGGQLLLAAAGAEELS